MDLMDIFTPGGSAVRPVHLAGEYAFAHDGWPGVLTLRVSSGRNLRGEYRDHRLDQTFAVTGQMDAEVRHQVTLVIHDFNWLPEQRFTGYFFTRGGKTIAGTTWWEEEPFGFVALQPDELAAPKPGQVTNQVAPGDFTGHYVMRHDDWEAEVDLEHTGGRLLAGVYRNADLDRDLTIEAEIDEQSPYGCTFRFTGDPRLDAVRAHGHLFTRPKNAISGELHNGDKTTGFVMLRRA